MLGNTQFDLLFAQLSKKSDKMINILYTWSNLPVERNRAIFDKFLMTSTNDARFNHSQMSHKLTIVEYMALIIYYNKLNDN